MTQIYRLMPDNDRFHNFALRDEAKSEVYRRFDGRPLRDSWVPLEITAADTDDELAMLGDHALLGTIPVLSRRAVDALRDLLEPAGEFLPLVYERAEYMAFNVTRIIDALDEGKSTINRFSDGRVMSVEKYAFRPATIDANAVFKIPQLRRAFIFATDPLPAAVKESHLTGFVFSSLE